MNGLAWFCFSLVRPAKRSSMHCAQAQVLPAKARPLIDKVVDSPERLERGSSSILWSLGVAGLAGFILACLGRAGC